MILIQGPGLSNAAGKDAEGLLDSPTAPSMLGRIVELSRFHELEESILKASDAEEQPP
jgi:hypothetical protein